MKLLQRAGGWLQPRLPYLNAGLVLAAYLANEHLLQAFCQPVRWAALMLLASVGAFLAWPWLPARPRWLRYLALLLQGALLPTGVYCVWFIGLRIMVASLAVFLLVVPLLAWVPVWVAGQAVWRGLRTALPGASLIFGLGVLGPLLAQAWAEWQFRQVAAAVAKLPAERRQDITALAAVIPRTYMAERLAGALFKYHNYLCLDDGWRPPLHDPLVNVCLWWRTGRDPDAGKPLANPLQVAGHRAPGLYDQLALYRQLFPGHPLKADCACSRNDDAQGYLDWQPGATSR